MPEFGVSSHEVGKPGMGVKMAKRVVNVPASLALLIAGSMPAVQVLAELPSDKYQDWTDEKEVLLTMHDGIRLSTDIYLPKGTKGPLPTILVRSPYDRDNLETVEPQMPYLKQGYRSGS
jgi:predicted acyl esterase